MKALNILCFLLVLNTFILLGFLFSQTTGNIIYEKISTNLIRVIDGDTIDTGMGRIRLLGINNKIL